MAALLQYPVIYLFAIMASFTVGYLTKITVQIGRSQRKKTGGEFQAERGAYRAGYSDGFLYARENKGGTFLDELKNAESKYIAGE